MTSHPQPSSLWQSADERTRITFDEWGLKPYTPLYCMEVGGGDTGFPYLELTVLQQGAQFLAAHGSVIMEDHFESVALAGAAAVQWGIDHGWDAKLSTLPAIGEVLEVQYRNGRGLVVRSPQGHERGR